ncbi:MAG: hypothetical protein AAF738_10165 [Bacteroidota bacterium]
MQIKAFFQNATTSWKTTLAAIITLVALLEPQLLAALDNDPKTVVDYWQIFASIGTFFGFLAAKDNDKSTEDHARILDIKKQIRTKTATATPELMPAKTK